MGGSTRLPLQVARKVAEKLLTVLEPYCEQIAIAGSIRRNKPEVGDIEIVAIPKMKSAAQQGALFGDAIHVGRETSLLDLALEEQIAAGRIWREPPIEGAKPAWGERYKKFWLPSPSQGIWIQVDLFIVRPPAQWGSQLVIRTGPGDFNKALMKFINDPEWSIWKQEDGRLVNRETGGEANTPTEEDYFQTLRLPFIPPAERSVERLAEVVRLVGRLNPTNDPPPESAPTIKAITLHQPWASLIAAGIKQYETRHWSTDYRGLLAIHAGKTEPTVSYSDLDLIRTKNDPLPDPPPLGCVVAIARLVAVIPSKELIWDAGISALEQRLGNFKPGRFGWKLEVVKVFDEPIPACGQQGLWEWDGWDGVIDDSPVPVPQPAAGQQEALTTRIKRELVKIPGLHRTVLVPRLGCTVREFDLAMWALLHLGTVKERIGCYWLAEDYPYGASAQPVEPAICTIPDAQTRAIILSFWMPGSPP